MTKTGTPGYGVLLTAEQILAAEDIKYVEVEVPEWGGMVRLKTLSGEEAAEFLSDEFQKDKKNASVRVLIMSAVKEDGTLMFTVDEIVKLRKKSLRAINRLQDAALKLNGLKEEDKEVKKD
jgi:hypothetical protein